MALHENHAGHHHARGHGNDEIDENGHHQHHQHHGHAGLGGMAQVLEIIPVDNVDTHLDQNTRQHGIGDIARQSTGTQSDGQQDDRMQGAGEGGLTA